MNGRYEIRGSNTLYKVWGIITFVFTGLYGLGWLIAFVLFGIGGSMAESASASYWLDYGMYLEDYFDQIQGYIIVVTLLIALIVIVGLIIRILAGLYLVRPYVKSKGALLAVGILYFLITLINLAWAIICGKAGSVGFTLFFLFCMGWAIATGVFLILKQEATVTGEYRDHGSRDSYEPVPYTQVSVDQGMPYTRVSEEVKNGLKASIEGMFGDYVGRRYILRPGENCRIGRDSGCDIQLRHSKVSRIHCAVKLLPDGRFEVIDYSYNGTFYENAAIPNNVATIVEAGGMLVIGDADNVFSLNIC